MYSSSQLRSSLYSSFQFYLSISRLDHKSLLPFFFSNLFLKTFKDYSLVLLFRIVKLSSTLTSPDQQQSDFWISACWRAEMCRILIPASHYANVFKRAAARFQQFGRPKFLDKWQRRFLHFGTLTFPEKSVISTKETKQTRQIIQVIWPSFSSYKLCEIKTRNFKFPLLTFSFLPA